MYSDDFKDTLAKLRPVIGDMADAFWLTALLDPTRQKDIHAVAQALAAELLGESYIGEHILLEPPPADKAAGDYSLGWVMYAGKPVCHFGLREAELPQHIAILGRSGAGKTNVGYLLVWNLLRAGKPFMALDWRRNYRHLSARPEAKRLLVLAAGGPQSLSFNPLQPPAGLTTNQQEVYLRDVISIMCTTYLPGHHLLSTRGVEYLFLKALEELRARSPESVTFNHLRGYVARYIPESRDREWKVSAENILLKVTTGPLGRIFNSIGSIALPDLLERQVILELDSLGSQTDRAAFTKALLVWLFYHRLAEGKSPTSKHVLVVEEAHQCFLKRHDGQQSVHDFMLRQMRDLGQAIVLLDQNPSLLSVPALGNTATTICLNLKHADDLEAAGKALTLPKEQWHYIGRLGVGQAIVKVPRSHTTPFLVQFPLFPVSEAPRASTTKAKPTVTDSLKTRLRELQLALDEAIRALRDIDTSEKEEEGIGAQERRLIMDMVEHPFSVVTERHKRLRWSAHTGTKVKRRLLEKGLIEEERIRVPEGTVTLLKLTQAGKPLLRAEGMEATAFPKNASLEHEYWKHRIGEDYGRRGYTVQEEVPIGNGQSVDLVATKDGKRTAIEIETGKSDAQRNIHKCKEAGFQDVISIPTPTAIKNQHRA